MQYSRKKAMAMREILVARFPLAFMPKGAPKKPLKIGIRDDLRAACPDLSRYKIGIALRDYTKGFLYLVELKENAPRVDLAGCAVDSVTKEHATAAAQEIAQRWPGHQRAAA